MRSKRIKREKIMKPFNPIFALVCTAACYSAIGHTESIEIGVMSFNIRYGSADDGENSWEHRKELVVDTIRKYDPVLVGTQETLQFQAKYLNDQLEEYGTFGLGRNHDGGGESMQVFYKAAEVMPVETGQFWYSESPDTPGSKSWDSSLPRAATWAKIWHIESKRFFYFINTHFDHRGKVARLESAKLLTKFAKKLDKNTPVILTGDFNSVAETSAPWKTLTGKLFTDSRTTAKEKVGPLGTFSRFQAPNSENLNRIDWILYKGPIKSLYNETVLFNKNGQYPSDHYPIYGNLLIE
jgi:endonuclease/exonuclease/phosphatase family metal-dependent hydrolase